MSQWRIRFLIRVLPFLKVSLFSKAVYNAGKWYLYAAAWLVIGWISGFWFVPAAIFMCAIGYGLLMVDRYQTFIEWQEHQKIHQQIPKDIQQIDATHWSVESMDGETHMIQMPDEYNMAVDGPIPLIKEYAPDLIECMTGGGDPTTVMRIHMQNPNRHNEEGSV